LKYIIIFIFAIFVQNLHSKDNFAIELSDLIRECDFFCIGTVSKADISHGTGGPTLIFEIKISEIIYKDSSVNFFANVNVGNSINVESYHGSYEYKAFSELFNEYIILLKYDSTTKVFKNIKSFSLKNYDINSIEISRNEFGKLKCEYCNNQVCGFIYGGRYSKYEEDKTFIPKEVKSYKLKLVDPIGRWLPFFPLENFLKYFYKIKYLK
jgi:hypothetical protein